MFARVKFVCRACERGAGDASEKNVKNFSGIGLQKFSDSLKLHCVMNVDVAF
jgi:hypothetical protein